jgi:hypothetical protein
MGITYRTDGAWGPGKGSDLNPVDVDNNFWQLVQDVTAKAVQGVGIANFQVIGDQMTVVLTDHMLLGPYTLPVVQITFRGAWLPLVQYYTNDIITQGGTTYIVLANHVSAATFDPGANNGLGQDYYGILLQSPAALLPSGGSIGFFLRKTSAADFASAWQTAALNTDLSDVSIIPSLGPAEGDVLTWLHGVWTNAAITVAFNQLAGVAVTAPQPGEPLVYNGLDWINTNVVDMPCGNLQPVSGTITINRSLGEVQRFSMVGNTTLTNITGWPTTGQFARTVLEIENTGGFTWAWPSFLWPDGVVPVVSLGISGTSRDVYIAVSFDGGSTVYGNVIGQNYM